VWGGRKEKEGVVCRWFLFLKRGKGRRGEGGRKKGREGNRIKKKKKKKKEGISRNMDKNGEKGGKGGDDDVEEGMGKRRLKTKNVIKDETINSSKEMIIKKK
jgi:hypothetical protein